MIVNHQSKYQHLIHVCFQSNLFLINNLFPILLHCFQSTNFVSNVLFFFNLIIMFPIYFNVSNLHISHHTTTTPDTNRTTPRHHSRTKTIFLSIFQKRLFIIGAVRSTNVVRGKQYLCHL